MTNMPPLAILHHGNCMDGITAAWVVSRSIAAVGRDVRIVPCLYGSPPPDVDGHEVIMVDFCYPAPVMRDIIRQSKGIVIVDHHKSAIPTVQALQEDAIPGRNVEIVFDLDHSGAMLAWRRFGSGPAPWLVQYVEDRDMWWFRLPDSKAINACIATTAHDVTALDDLAAKPLGECVADGKAILRMQDHLVRAQVAHAYEAYLGGHKVLVSNASVLFSETAGALAKDRPFGVTWFRRGDGLYQFSLRSTAQGLDVCDVAKGFGGGGHARAAGFEVGDINRVLTWNPDCRAAVAPVTAPAP